MARLNSCDVVIVNWNAGQQIAQCVTSLDDKTIRHIVVVDNGSVDGSADLIGDAPKVRVIRSGLNLGFGKACNRGAHGTDADYILFLNPDATVYAGTLERVLTFMEDPGNSRVGICGVQLVDESGQVARSCARFPSARGFAVHAVGLDRLVPSWGHFMSEWPHDATREVDQLIGAFFLVRRALFESLRGFDERFFVYFEEVDFSYRAHQAGWSSVYLADVQAFHAGGGTSNQIKARRLFYSLRSRLLYAAKHFNAGGVALVCFTTLLIEPLSRSAFALGKFSWSALKETWAGYALLWAWLPQWLLKGKTR